MASPEIRRRKVLASLTGVGVASLAGCADDEFEPDISETIRIGAAESVRLDDEVEISSTGFDTLKEEATVQANVRVHDYVSSRLRGEAGGGIFLSIDHITVEEIEDDVSEEELNRERPVATIVKQRYLYTEDGELVTEDPLQIDTLREMIPRTVEVDTVFGEEQYTAVLPVVVHRYWEHPDHE